MYEEGNNRTVSSNTSRKIAGKIFADTKQIAADEMLCGDFVLQARATEPRIGNDGRQNVSRKFDFGNDFHVTDLSVSDQFFYVFLGVESSQTVVIGTCPCTHLGQDGIFLISNRQPESSIKWNCSLFNLYMAIMSMYFSRTLCRRNNEPRPASCLARGDWGHRISLRRGQSIPLHAAVCRCTLGEERVAVAFVCRRICRLRPAGQ